MNAKNRIITSKLSLPAFSSLNSYVIADDDSQNKKEKFKNFVIPSYAIFWLQSLNVFLCSCFLNLFL